MCSVAAVVVSESDYNDSYYDSWFITKCEINIHELHHFGFSSLIKLAREI